MMESTLTTDQETILAIVPAISGSLSIIGSSLTIYLIAKSTNIISYQRILFVMSFCNAILSITYALQPYLVPAATSRRLWAMGNTGTCLALGFLYHVSLSAIWYNGMLSFYYLLTIRLSYHEQKMRKTVEPLIHSLALGLNIICSTLGITFGVYQEKELGYGCWIGTEWCTGMFKNCSTIVKLLKLGFEGVPLFSIALCIVVNNLLIFCYVRRKRRKRHRRQRQQAYNIHRFQDDKDETEVLMVQSYCYAGSFFLSYLCVISFQVLDALRETFFSDITEESVYVLLLVQAILAPLQGFLNVFIYIYSIYAVLRMKYPERSVCWVLRRVWVEPIITNPRQSAERPNKHGISQFALTLDEELRRQQQQYYVQGQTEQDQQLQAPPESYPMNGEDDDDDEYDEYDDTIPTTTFIHTDRTGADDVSSISYSTRRFEQEQHPEDALLPSGLDANDDDAISDMPGNPKLFVPAYAGTIPKKSLFDDTSFQSGTLPLNDDADNNSHDTSTTDTNQRGKWRFRHKLPKPASVTQADVNNDDDNDKNNGNDNAFINDDDDDDDDEEEDEVYQMDDKYVVEVDEDRNHGSSTASRTSRSSKKEASVPPPNDQFLDYKWLMGGGTVDTDPPRCILQEYPMARNLAIETARSRMRNLESILHSSKSGHWGNHNCATPQILE